MTLIDEFILPREMSQVVEIGDIATLPIGADVREYVMVNDRFTIKCRNFVVASVSNDSRYTEVFAEVEAKHEPSQRDIEVYNETADIRNIQVGLFNNHSMKVAFAEWRDNTGELFMVGAYDSNNNPYYRRVKEYFDRPDTRELVMINRQV